jgi:hypothetical protein
LKASRGNPREWVVREGRGEARSAHAHFQAYRALDEARKARVLTPEGLAFDAMTPEQQEAFVTLLGPEYGPGMLDVIDKLKLQVSQNDGRSDRPDRRAVDLLLRWREDEPNRGPMVERLSISFPAPVKGVGEKGSEGVAASGPGGKGGGDGVKTVKR